MKDNVNTVQYNVTKKKRKWKETFRAGGKINNLHLGKGNSEKGWDLLEKNTAAYANEKKSPT